MFPVQPQEIAIPKPQNTHAKRQREQAKKRKSEEKQQRRNARRAEADSAATDTSEAVQQMLSD